MSISRTRILAVFATVLLLFAMMLCAGCSSSSSSNGSTPKVRSNPQPSATQEPSNSEQANKSPGISPQQIPNRQSNSAPTVDPHWPTTNLDLLAIPEEQRWYNGWAVAGTNCTLSGPVVRVYQAQDEASAPIFIDIGEAYPSTNGVTLLVWGDQYYDFAEMINAVDDGGAWLRVSGYLSVYNDQLQFDAGEGYVEYQWWTGVW